MPPLDQPPRQWRGRVDDAELMAREFPAIADALKRPQSRRHVLRLMAASAALAGLGGCDPSAPDGHYVPAVNQAADIVPGLPNRYATAVLDGGTAAGIVVRQEMGRPIKVEGNPAHPGSLGATSIHGQSLILDFYDPDRAAGVLKNGDVATWQSLLGACLDQRAKLEADKGAGLRVVTGRVVSPTMGAAIDGVLKHYDQAKWIQWESVSRDNVTRGTSLAYGRPLDLLPHVAAADVILALDSDLICSAPGHLRHARDFASRRNPTRAKMSRVYAAEPIPTLIGGAADHRFIAGPRELATIVNALAAGILGGDAAADAPDWVAAVVADLKAAGRNAFVHAGPDLSPEAHALIHRVNEKLGGRGTTFDFIEPVAWRTDDETAAMTGLIDDMQAGRVSSLLVLDGNPVYAAKGFREALAKVPFSLSSAASPDETARRTNWYVPRTHLFEEWGDARAHDGTVAIQQPQALPLYGGHSALEVLSLLASDLTGNGAAVSGRDLGTPDLARPTRRQLVGGSACRWLCAKHCQHTLDHTARGGFAKQAGRHPGCARADVTHSPRPEPVGRAARQQSLATGTAAPCRQDRVGQSDPAGAGHGRPLQHCQRRRDRTCCRQRERHGARLHRARPGPGLHRRLARRRADQRRQSWQRGRHRHHTAPRHRHRAQPAQDRPHYPRRQHRSSQRARSRPAGNRRGRSSRHTRAVPREARLSARERCRAHDLPARASVRVSRGA